MRERTKEKKPNTKKYSAAKCGETMANKQSSPIGKTGSGSPPPT